ncbi:MAG: hypothetical protein JOZ51_15285 [Chloroflexi bacterium]|nr:hypothetical protein [Chloroflexota bacterium]
MDLDRIFDHALAADWSPKTRAIYRDFSERLMQRDALTVKVGKGGLSYYKTTAGGPIFVCHFNAEPRGGNADLGFADFRRDTLERVLDFPMMLADLQAALGPEITIKPGNIWYSFHFPLARRAEIADALRAQIISQIAA